MQSNIAGSEALGTGDIRREIFDFMGGEQRQFLFLALVCGGWKDIFARDGKETACSQVVMSASRVMEAVGHGWVASNGAWKHAAALGDMEVLDCMTAPESAHEWEERDWEDETEREEKWERASWGDRIFAAAAEAGQHEVMEFLIVRGCNKDRMGVKALEVAVQSDSVDVMNCCFVSDYWSENVGVRIEQQNAASDIVTPRFKLAMAARDVDMVRSLSRFVIGGDDGMQAQLLGYAKDDDLEMVLALESWIEAPDNDDIYLLDRTLWTAAMYGNFRVVSHLLTWWWRGANMDGRRPVPDGVMYMAARLGYLRMLQWCAEWCDAVVRHTCIHCDSVTVEEWSRVPADAAGAGHVQVVLWCLDNGWEFTDSIVEAAAKEGRQNVVMALSERGFSCRFSVEEAAPPQMPGENLWQTFLHELPRCDC